MKLKRYISLLLLTVYFMSVSGQSFVSLSCKCSTPHARTVAVASGAAETPSAATQTHSCSHCRTYHCGHDAAGQNALAAAHKSLSQACTCGSHHSNEIKLYTGSAPDNEKTARCSVTTLPPAMAAAIPAAVDSPLPTVKTAERHVPLDACDYAGTQGLRAPPVLI